MKAIVYDRYGPPEFLYLAEIERPVPRDDQVLVRVHTASVNASDWECLRGRPIYARMGGLFRPGNPILGSDIAGIVEAGGSRASRFRPGDQVFGLLSGYAGGFAEYACARETALARVPPGMTFEQAATLPQAGVIALQGIRTQGKVQSGEEVLINGAGGGAGSFAVQLAKLDGASVTGVDNSEKLDFLRSLGADHVIDYTREDFTRSGKQYDLILDVIATRSAFAYPRALKPNGRYFCVGGSVATMLQALILGGRIRRSSGKSVGVLMVQSSVTDMLSMADLCRAGTIRPVIDRRFALEAVPEALRYLGEGHARGKIVIAVASG
jgi:NADPH:quinone reductase-like Zn-dependent oxidoreductase